MNLPELARAFFKTIEPQVGPFDRPLQFRPFPFDAGGDLNFLTVGAGREPFVTYVSWDLFGHEKQKRGSLGRYELLAVGNDESWCREVLTRIGRQALEEVLEPGDTLDIGSWGRQDGTLRGVVFETALSLELGEVSRERCGLLRCIGVTGEELAFAKAHGVAALTERLRSAGIYPRTDVNRKESVRLEA